MLRVARFFGMTPPPYPGASLFPYTTLFRSPAAEQTQETAPEEESAEPEEDPVSPAPEDALELEEVRSPTGNIACSLAEDSVGCSVADRDFSEAGLEDCEQGVFSLQVAGDGDRKSVV